MSDTACEASPCKLFIRNDVQWCPGMPTSCELLQCVELHNYGYYVISNVYDADI